MTIHQVIKDIFKVNSVYRNGKIYFNKNNNLILPTKKENEIINQKIRELEAIDRTVKQQQTFNNAIQTHLDNKAKEFRYDNMMSARSYAGYTNPFQDEAQKLAIWASNCWVKAGEIEADVKAGNRAMPTIDEVLAELPAY